MHIASYYSLVVERVITLRFKNETLILKECGGLGSK